VFGGVEHESGQTFLVPVQDRTVDTLLAVICDWIETGTRVISDYWGANVQCHWYYRTLCCFCMTKWWISDPERPRAWW
jgi:uncharacterized protein YaaQ